MSCLWNENKTGAFFKRTLLQSLIVVLITLACIGGAWICGIPVLSWLYNTDLSAYKAELLIVLLGGGFLGLSGFLNVVITIMRRHRLLLVGYMVTALLAFLLSGKVVGACGVMGASVLYTVLMAVLCVIFYVIFVAGIICKRKDFSVPHCSRNE